MRMLSKYHSRPRATETTRTPALGMLHLQEWRIGLGTCAIDRQAVEVNAESSEMQIQILETYWNAQALSGLLLN